MQVMDILHLLLQRFQRRFQPPLPAVLQPGQPKRLRLAAASALHLLHGRVWITVEGQAADWFVATGESLNLPAGRLIVIECDSTDAASLRWPAAAAFSGACVPAPASS